MSGKRLPEPEVSRKDVACDPQQVRSLSRIRGRQAGPISVSDRIGKRLDNRFDLLPISAERIVHLGPECSIFTRTKCRLDGFDGPVAVRRARETIPEGAAVVDKRHPKEEIPFR